MKFMTLTEFRASGRDVDQGTLEAKAGTELGGTLGGRLYAGDYLYIERYAPDEASPMIAAGDWHLCIMNDSWLAPLHTLEALLYSYARVEVLPAPPDEQAALVDEWQTFCRDEGLECVSADEMDPYKLTAAQRDYVHEYIARWDKEVAVFKARE